ncbi:MAG: DNA polymerase III subunit gamma/tau [Coriobacteriia bacterium]|nr:DNA polymerase III subunit gamma/tau [Coriobacteriia bacterium]
MAHQSLYRKYRPQTFSDVVGQEHIERTLRNAVGDGTVAHAYLFCGPRGTGKTTTARILAKALNCEHGPTPDPDGTCQQCLEIAEGRHPDVYELDAASRTGVDNVREEIIGRVQFAPTRGHYKVYIIDEVHMLSTAAFNALLKTLEEPPSHVIFVLATTHPHKVPETIQSRCQRFDFRRIGIDDIVGRLRAICEGEGFSVPDAALALIARHASGGMRDAITTLEQLASFTGGTITMADVEGLLGEVDTAQLFGIAGLIAARDVASCFRWVASFVEDGTDLAEFVRELTGHFRNLYVLAAVGDGHGIVDAGSEDLTALAEQAVEFGGPDRLARVLTLLGELAAELRWSSDPRLSLEVAFTRMARPDGEMTLESLAERIEALERGTGAQAPRPAAIVPRQTESVPAPAPAAPVRQAASRQATRPGELDRAAAKRIWSDVLAEIRDRKPARAHLLSTVDVDVDADGTLVLEFPQDQSFSMQLAEEPEMRDLLRVALTVVLGEAPPVRMQIGRGGMHRAAAAASHEPTASPAPKPERKHSSEPASALAAAPAATDDAAPTDLAQFLVDGLGARIVAEHGALSTEPVDEQTDESEAADDYQGFMSFGDGMLDETIGEDD